MTDLADLPDLPAGLRLVHASQPSHYDTARALFIEYAARLRIDLCFQGFEAELGQLPAMYGPPAGALVLALRGPAGAAVGCVALRRFDDGNCELKRLYVRDEARGAGLGRHLTEAAIDAARRIGYRRMLLDTLADMRAARRLYAALGFVAIPAYYDNPLAGVSYMALDLK